MITAGEVRVNGQVVTELGTKADPTADSIRVGRRLLPRVQRFEYWMLHKPVGVVTTLSDPEGRPSIGDLVRELDRHVHPVGRLDYHSSGLLLLTNDGELTERLTHPRYHVEKRYTVKLSSVPSDRVVDLLRNGIRLPDGKTAPAYVRVTRRANGKAWLDVRIVEGRNRQIRRMFDAVGLRVDKLRRVSIGALALGRLPTGNARRLTREEVLALFDAVGFEASRFDRKKS